MHLQPFHLRWHIKAVLTLVRYDQLSSQPIASAEGLLSSSEIPVPRSSDELKVFLVLSENSPARLPATAVWLFLLFLGQKCARKGSFQIC